MKRLITVIVLVPVLYLLMYGTVSVAKDSEDVTRFAIDVYAQEATLCDDMIENMLSHHRKLTLIVDKVVDKYSVDSARAQELIRLVLETESRILQNIRTCRNMKHDE